MVQMVLSSTLMNAIILLLMSVSLALQRHMVSADNTSGPVPQSKERWFVPNPALAIPYVPPTNKELELLFQPMFDEYFTPPGDRQVPTINAVQVPINFTDHQFPSPVFRLSPSGVLLYTLSSDYQSSSVHLGVAAEQSFEVNPFFAADLEPFVNVFAPDSNSKASSSGVLVIILSPLKSTLKELSGLFAVSSRNLNMGLLYRKTPPCALIAFADAASLRVVKTLEEDTIWQCSNSLCDKEYQLVDIFLRHPEKRFKIHSPAAWNKSIGSQRTQPELPDRNATIKDSPTGKIGIYTRLIEFANFRIPLSKFLLCVLEYYRINFSQLSVIAATKIDASICPIFVPWFEDVSFKRDHLPSDDAIDVPLTELLDENCTFIRKYPELFLSVIGLNRSFVDTDIRSTFLYRDGEGRFTTHEATTSLTGAQIEEDSF
ncbi:hypothetical protein Tco_1439682 [Tanacetum coccineum]